MHHECIKIHLTIAFYRKKQSTLGDLWYPNAVLVGKPVTTEELAEELAAESTVAPADVLAVLRALSGVMGRHMANGRSVKLYGIGSFYYTIAANRNGVETPEEVSARQIKGIRVRFRPETTYRIGGSTGRVATRALTDVKVDWIDIDTLAGNVKVTDAPDKE